MTNVTQILQAINGERLHAVDDLLPLVYRELRRIAQKKMDQESPDHTLNATGLVHEAYLRLVGTDRGAAWENRRHFFAAAAEAMRRILIESARRRMRLKRGGDREQVPLKDIPVAATVPIDRLLAIDEALDRLTTEDPDAAEIVKLRFFAGFSVEEAAESLGLTRATAYRHWKFARAWMQCELESG